MWLPLWHCPECSTQFRMLQKVELVRVGTRPGGRSRSRTPLRRGNGKGKGKGDDSPGACAAGASARQYIGCQVMVLQRPSPAPRGKTYGLAVGSMAVITAYEMCDGFGYYTLRQQDAEVMIEHEHLRTHFRVME